MKYEFSKPKNHTQKYKNGTELPHQMQYIILNGKRVGYIEIHMHRNSKGISCGITTVVYK